MPTVRIDKPGYEFYRESTDQVRGRPVTQMWKRNGVRVTVRRNDNGSTVQADCQCLGFEGRLHSSTFCPQFVAATRRAMRGGDVPARDTVSS